MPKSKLFLLDAHALCYRSYYAIKGLSTSKGQATNAIYGFVKTLKKILRDYNPDYMAVCFDVGAKTLRQEKYAEYKIQRPSMPDDMISQIPIIKDVIEAFNLPIFEMEGFEADDIIATLANKFSKKGNEVIIVSDDKDMLQLVNDNVKVFSARKEKIFDYQEAKASLGFEPKNIVDFIGLAGDQTDNIPGVSGIGEVTAKNWVKKYGELENILKNIDKLPAGKFKEKLQDQKDMALFSKELSILDSSVPIECNLEKMKIKTPDRKQLFEIFKELEFKGLAQEFSDQSAEAKTLKIKTVKNKGDLKSLIDQITGKNHFAFLIGEDGQSAAVSLGREVYSLNSDQIAGLKPVFEDKKVVKVSHNIKDGMKVLSERGCAVKGRIFDVMLAGYLLVPSQGSFDIEALAWTYFKEAVPADERLLREADYVYRLFNPMLQELKEKSLLKLFEEVEVPLAYVLFRMETSGVKLDEDLLIKLSKECQHKIELLESQLYKLAGTEFNLNSPKQLSQVLFEKLKLPVIKKTKTGFSTDESVLTKLAVQHELPALILEYRQLAKLKSTYIDALPKLIDAKTTNLHATFNQTGTETGRLSSNNPNLQNIPIRTQLGREIRKAFVPSKKDNVIISADYSQIELRILAHLSKDENLKKAFNQNQDIHSFTASLIFDVKEKDVTAKMRDTAKRVNFGIIYGMSAFGLSKDLKISQGEAQEFIDKYFLRYPKVKQFMNNEIKKCEKNGYVVTILNRRRYLPEIKNDNFSVMQFAQRQAINTPVQGSAADLMKLAMINIQKELEEKKLQSRMIITVHDELVFDTPQEEEKEMIKLIRRQMENPLKLTVAIKVSVKVGKNWLDMKEVK